MRDRLRGPSAVRVADQLASSASTFLVQLIAVRWLGTRDLAAFSVAFVVFTTALLLTRAACGQAFLIRSERVPEHRGYLLLSLGFALLAALGLLSLQLYWHDWWLTAAAGAGLSLLLVQDTLRYVGLARAPRRALAADVLWLVLELALVVAAPRSWHSPAVLVVVFAGTGLVGSLPLLVGWRTWVAAPTGAGWWGPWWRQARTLSASLLGDAALLLVSTQLVFLALAVTTGDDGIAGYRSALVFFAPLNTLVGLLSVALLPRLQSLSSRRALELCWGAGAAMAGLCLAIWGLLALSPSLTRLVVGHNAGIARPVLLPLALASAAASLLFCLATALRASEAVRPLLQLRTLWSCVDPVAGLVGGLVGGTPRAVLFAVAISQGVAVLHWGAVTTRAVLHRPAVSP